VTSAPPAGEGLPTSDPHLQFAIHGDGHLAFVDEGPRAAPALFMVHGVPGSVRDFRYLAPQLTERVRVIRVDLPGFGGSALQRDAVETIAGRARAVLALVGHLGLDRFGILGHSMGGATALTLAAAHRDRVTLLVLVASMALRPHRGLGMSPRRFRWLARGLRVPLLRELIMARTRERYRRLRFPGADEMDAKHFALQFRAIGAADFALLRRAAVGPLPATLLAYARDDHLIETEISEELVRALPHARVLAFDHGGHNLQKTRAVELAAAIKESLGV
jgi:pimeloyl-ACP methyl ester carboxylesterase